MKKWKTLYSRKESWNLFAKRWSHCNQAYLHWIQRFCALGPDRPLVKVLGEGSAGSSSRWRSRTWVWPSTATWPWAKLPIFLVSLTSVKWAEQSSCHAVILWNCVKAWERCRGNRDLSPISLFLSSPILSFSFLRFLKNFSGGWGQQEKVGFIGDLGNRKAGICFQTSLNNVSQSGIWGHLHQRNLRGSCQLQGSTGHDEPVQSVAPGVCLLMRALGPQTQPSRQTIITLLFWPNLLCSGVHSSLTKLGANPVWFERIRKPLVPPLMTGLAEGRGPVLIKGICQGQRAGGSGKLASLSGTPLSLPPLHVAVSLWCLGLGSVLHPREQPKAELKVSSCTGIHQVWWGFWGRQF